jgi:hypothetical protein
MTWLGLCFFCRIIFLQNDYPFRLLGWALFWGVWLGLCFLGRIILGRIILDGVAGALFFLPQKGTRKHKILDGRVYAAGRFLCIFVPLCGYDFAGGWVVASDLRVSCDNGR